MDTYAQPTTDIFLDEPIEYGTFWERLGAYIIDVIILIIPTLILQYMINDVGSTLISIAIDWLYFALQESGHNQATIGKKALGLKVTSMDGQRITFGQASGRYFGKIISGLILCIGYLMILWDDRRQGLHDKMAGTLVIKNRQ
ncbi:MAG: RDD family protein [Flavisolibacter sp.]|jgi:uncharacterized RDD family membrane protein YckC